MASNRYCFLVAMEARGDDYYYNQVKLLLYSFRKYAGKLKNAHFYLSVNNGALSKEKAKFLVQNFGPITVSQKRYVHGMKLLPTSVLSVNGRVILPFYRKYNIFRHFDMLKRFDRFVYLDCDMMIGPGRKGRTLFDILEENTNSYAATPSSKSGKVHYFRRVLHDNFGVSYAELKRLKVSWAKAKAPWMWIQIKEKLDRVDTKRMKKIIRKVKAKEEGKGKEKRKKKYNEYPHFNGGIFVVDRRGFMIIRDHIYPYIEKTVRLMEKGALETGPGNYVQTAAAILVITKIKNYGILKLRYEGPCLYHNFKFKYGELHYKNPSHPRVREYAKSNSPNKRFICRIISSYLRDFPNDFHIRKS